MKGVDEKKAANNWWWCSVLKGGVDEKEKGGYKSLKKKTNSLPKTEKRCFLCVLERK